MDNFEQGRKRAAYSQNFIRDARLVKKLVMQSSINKDDIVVEIGAGNGIITNQLSLVCGEVIALEKDQNLYRKLVERFRDYKNVKCVLADFLTYELPDKEYKIFSNIPFSSSADIVKKITTSKNPPVEAYLIVQYEFAKKYIGKPIAKINSQISILLKPWFDISLFYKFRREDFYPKPGVDTVMIKIQKIEEPLIKSVDIYRDFVVYAFTQFRSNIAESLSQIMSKRQIENLDFYHKAKPSELHFLNWVDIFNSFIVSSSENQKKKIQGFYARQLKQQSLLQKRPRIKKI